MKWLEKKKARHFQSVFSSFAYFSIKDRIPKIVTGIVDKLYKYHHKAVQKHGYVNENHFNNYIKIAESWRRCEWHYRETVRITVQNWDGQTAGTNC